MANRYEILRKLGQGGMGTVYLARLKGEAGFERLVALKKLTPEALSSADLRGLFEREIRLGAQLVHPCIVQVVDAGLSGGEPYLSTEFVDGGDLEDVMSGLRSSGGRLAPEAVAYIGSQVCQALAFMTSLKDDAGKLLVQAHRDVSLGNVLVSRSGGVKLADFGVARLTTSKTSAAVVRGKWQYFAPEIATQDPDVRADLFALAIVLYQLCTLVHPFEASTPQGFYERASTFVVHQPPEIPSGLWAVIDRALAKNPDQRFQTAEQMGEKLDAFIFAAGRPMTPGVLARIAAPLLPLAVPLTADLKLSRPFEAAVTEGQGAFEFNPDWQAPSVAMGSDGRMVGTPTVPTAPAPEVRAPPPARSIASSPPIESVGESLAPSPHAGLKSLAEVERLELHDKPLVPYPTAQPEAPAATRSKLLPLVGLLVLAGVGGLIYLAAKPHLGGVSLGSSSDAPMVLIDSDPPGATVMSGTERLGETPLSFSNDYPANQVVNLTVRHRGYKPASIGFVGGKAQHVTAHLDRAR